MASRSFVPKAAYNWRGANTHALVTTIWYPATSSSVEHPTDIPGLSDVFVLGSTARDADLAATTSKFPLIVMSHGTGGTGLTMSWLGIELARHGYIVAAVNHPGNNGAEPYTAGGFSTWWERARDLSVVIDSMLDDSTFGQRYRCPANRCGGVFPRGLHHDRDRWRHHGPRGVQAFL